MSGGKRQGETGRQGGCCAEATKPKRLARHPQAIDTARPTCHILQRRSPRVWQSALAALERIHCLRASRSRCLHQSTVDR